MGFSPCFPFRPWHYVAQAFKDHRSLVQIEPEPEGVDLPERWEAIYKV